MNKPLVLEELGKQVQNNISTNTLDTDILNVRQPFMQMVYSAFNQSLIAGDVWRGELPLKIAKKPLRATESVLNLASLPKIGANLLHT